MNYKEEIQHPKWQKKRLEILERDNFTCQLCGDAETQLHVHHKSYNNNPWGVENTELITLCKHCHALIHFENNPKITNFKILKLKSIIVPKVLFIYVITTLGFKVFHYLNNIIETGSVVDYNHLKHIIEFKNKNI